MQIWHCSKSANSNTKAGWLGFLIWSFLKFLARYRDNQDDALETSNKTTALSVIQRMALQGNRLSNAAKLNNDKSLASKRPFSEVLTPEDVSRRLWQEFGHAPQSSFPKFQSFSNESIRLSNSSQPKRMITNFRVRKIHLDNIKLFQFLCIVMWIWYTKNKREKGKNTK